ncbi:MAG: prepilin peptidase [Gammaproteobacteria bacterium]
MTNFADLSVQQWLLIAWAALCSGMDWWHRKLPNVLTLGAAAAALAILLLSGKGWLEASWISCTGAALVALLLTLPAYSFRYLGAGDVKLLVAMGLLGGMRVLLITYAVAGLAVGTIALIWIWMYRWQAWFSYRFAEIGVQDFSVPEPRGRRLPFGFALALGFVLAIVGGKSPLLAV